MIEDIGKIKYCLNLQIEHSIYVILYIEKTLKRFQMDKAYALSTPMVIRSIDTKKDPHRPKGDDENVLDPEISTQTITYGNKL